MEDKIIIPSALTENSGGSSSENTINIPSALSANSNNDISAAAICIGAVEAGTCIIDCQTTSETCGTCEWNVQCGTCEFSYEGCATLSEGCGTAEIDPCTVICQNDKQDCDYCEINEDCYYCEFDEEAYSPPSVGSGIFVSDITATSAYIYYDTIDKATSYRIAYRKSTTSTATTRITTDNPYYLSGLEPNTTYVVNYEGINDYGAGGYMSSGVSFTTKSLYWSWEASNGSATDSQTQAAYYAITNNGKLTDFSYLVWNDMCECILAVMKIKGHSWVSSSYGLTFDETLMTYSDKYMTAARFNSLRYNVGRIYSTGISEVSKGDIIYGSYFVDLMDKVNEWIDE